MWLKGFSKDRWYIVAQNVLEPMDIKVINKGSREDHDFASRKI